MPVHPSLPDRPVDEAASLASLEQGGLPIRAQRRIYETNAPGAHPIVTSTLSPSESVVARLTGLEPISQVMGSSVYHVGLRGYPQSGSGGELVALTTAYEHARSRALSRMQQEASMLRAHAVIDVKFLSRGYDWAEGMLEFTAVGTAVRIAGAPAPQQPALTLLKADELWKLHRAGYWPVAIAIGNCFWYAPHADCFSEGTYYSSELPAHTRASMSARELAVDRFRTFAHHFQADGVVGVRVERAGSDSEWEVNDTRHTSFSLDLVVMGTAVVRRSQVPAPPRPQLVIDLRDIKSRYGTHGLSGLAHSEDGDDDDADDADENEIDGSGEAGDTD